MGHYKGEFLWNTTDFAMWTTVEVGIGITAGSLATLKPLMKNFLSCFGIHSTQNPSSNMPWSAKPSHVHSKLSSKISYGQDGPAVGKTGTTTTVTGRGGITGNDSEEDIFPIRAGAPDERNFLELADWKGGISKSVQVTTTEERGTAPVGASPSSSRDRDDDNRHSYKPAMIYERL